jgi:nicotinamide phosphoribosyltransferase
MTETSVNPILNTDSYKLSHYLQYPPDTRGMSIYAEARPGGEYDHVLFFGLQMFLKDYLSKPVTKADIDEAEEMVTAHGLPFNRKGWERIVERHGGCLPLEIEALPEGLVVPAGTPLVQARNTDPELFWLSTYVETALLRAVWYPSTVATVSHGVRRTISAALEKSCDDPGPVLPFRLHDFGARGTTSFEQAGIGGAAHLVSFMGTDTVTGLVYARRFYGEPMAGFSIPAAEHSTMTSWGEEGETDAFRNMLRQFGGEGRLVAVVSDSYDLYRAVRKTWGERLKDEVRAMGGTLVVRPDSGDPTKVPIDVVEMLGESYGHTVNARGYKVLDPAVRVIQGDGVTPKTIAIILDNLLARGWSAENLAFGMGAGLLQKVNRDTLRFALKANARLGEDGEWTPVHKDPKTDPSKASKAGRQAVIRDGDSYRAVEVSELDGRENLLRPVWRDGELLVDHSFAEIRERAAP